MSICPIMSVMDSLLSDIYPVGSTYISTTNSCPMSTLINGSTWTQIASNVVVSVDSNVPIKGNGIALGLTDGTNNAGLNAYSGVGCIGDISTYGKSVGTSDSSDKFLKLNTAAGITTDSSKSGIVGTVTRTNLTLYIFKRTA